MVATASLPMDFERVSHEEQRFVLVGVPWKTYVLLREAIDDPALKMTYCEGALELMSPSQPHEENKSLVARLIEHYSLLVRGRLNGYGSTTFRRESKERGVEPDECYKVGAPLREGEFPDIVLEVIETRPLVDKLTVYDGLEVPEVWLFEKGKLSFFRRKPKGGYAPTRRSGFLPKLDPELIARYASWTDQEEAVREFASHIKPARARRR